MMEKMKEKEEASIKKRSPSKVARSASLDTQIKKREEDAARQQLREEALEAAKRKQLQEEKRRREMVTIRARRDQRLAEKAKVSV